MSETMVVTTPQPGTLPVLLAGSATTAAALLGIYYLGAAGFNPMSWYLDYVIPVGSVAVGLVASSGFAMASWKTGYRISGLLLFGVVAILTGGYFLAQYLEFHLAFPEGAAHRDGSAAGFWDWFRALTVSIAFEENGKRGEPLGLLGYGVRALEIAGFAGGGVLIPFSLRSKPYCFGCGLYMRSDRLAMVAAGLAPKLFGDKSPAREEERRRLAAESTAVMDGLFASAARSGTNLKEAAAPYRPRRRLTTPPVWQELTLIHCRRCHEGRLVATLVTRKGNQFTRRPLRAVELHSGTVEEATLP